MTVISPAILIRFIMAGSEDDDDIQAYLKNLSKKTTTKPDKNRKFKLPLSDDDIDLSSISLSDEDIKEYSSEALREGNVMSTKSHNDSKDLIQEINSVISDQSIGIKSKHSSSTDSDSAAPKIQDLQSIPDDDDLVENLENKSISSISESLQLQVHDIDELLSDPDDITEELNSHQESQEEIEEHVDNDSPDNGHDYSSIKSEDDISSRQVSQSSLAENIRSMSNLESSDYTIQEKSDYGDSIHSDNHDNYSSDDFVSEGSTTRKQSFTSPSSDSNYTTSYTTGSSPTSKSAPVAKSKARDFTIAKDAEVQTDLPPMQTKVQAVMGASYGSQYVDPTPIATHVVSADALEAVTAYNPISVALNNMLRDQLNLTRDFVNSNKRIYNAEINSIESSSYHYVTLQDTKKYIQENRKPRLTFEEALRQTLAEQEY